jgi:hypothetical protein
MQDVELNVPNEEWPEEYEEPVLLGADDLEDVAGGCVAFCEDGSCRPKP